MSLITVVQRPAREYRSSIRAPYRERGIPGEPQPLHSARMVWGLQLRPRTWKAVNLSVTQ